MVSIEDYMLDLILSQDLIYTKKKVKNPWLKNPLKMEEYFTIREGRLQLNFESKFLKSSFGNAGGEDIFSKDLEVAFVDVLTNPSRFFDSLYKYKYEPGRSFAHAIAVFVVFLGKYLKRQHIVYVTEFIVMFAHQLLAKKEPDVSISRYIVITFLKNQDFRTIDETEEQFLVFQANQQGPTLRPKFLVGIFIDFLVGQDFLTL